MARKKTSSEIEHLRGIIRNLEAQVRDLKKQLAKAKPTIILKEVVREQESPKANKCPICSKKIKEIDVGLKKLALCEDSSCSYRKVILISK